MRDILSTNAYQAPSKSFMLRILLLSLCFVTATLKVFAQNKAIIDSLKAELQNDINENQKADGYKLCAPFLLFSERIL